MKKRTLLKKLRLQQQMILVCQEAIIKLITETESLKTLHRRLENLVLLRSHGLAPSKSDSYSTDPQLPDEVMDLKTMT